MIPLINSGDGFILSEFDFPDNAMFYKDMIAFADAYTRFVGYGLNNLPNYCYINGKIYLDGMCLLIKDYSAEFDFETLDLTIEYLRVLYFAVASFSENGEFPDKAVIEEKFEDKKYKNKVLYHETSEKAETAKDFYDAAANKYELQASVNNKLKSKLKRVSRFSFLILLIGFLGAGAFAAISFIGGFDKIIGVPAAVGVFVVCLFLFILGRLKVKKVLNELKDTETETEKLIQDKYDKLERYKEIISQKTQINNEIYKFIYCITNMDLMNNNTDYSKILDKAMSFNMLSYNLEYDVTNSYMTHDNEILGMVEKITTLPKNNDLYNSLNSCYKEIVNKNWLYHNRYIRYAFIQKMIISANLSNNWHVYIGGKYENPFGVDVKSIAEERVAFLENENSLLVEMPVNRLLMIDNIRRDNSLKITSDATEESLEFIKMNYANKFYNLVESKKLTGFFYNDNSAKSNKNRKVDMVLLEDKHIIPDLFLMKIKLIEARNGFENSHLEKINKLNETILQRIEEQDDDTLLSMSLLNLDENIELSELDLNDVIGNNIDCDKIEEFVNGCVQYMHNGKKIVGYKF